MLACAIVKIFVKCLMDTGIAQVWQWCLHLKHALHSDIQRLWDISKHNNFFFFLEISICTCIRLLFFYIIYTCIFKCSVISIVFCLTMNLQCFIAVYFDTNDSFVMVCYDRTFTIFILVLSWRNKNKDHVLKFPVFCSLQNNYKIQATRLTHEIDDMRRRLENAKMKLTAEMKVCHLTSPYHQHSFPTLSPLNFCSYFPLLWH